MDLKKIPPFAEIWYPIHSYRYYDAANGRPLDVQPILAEQSKLVLPVTGILVDNIKIAQKLLYGPHADLSDEMLEDTLHAWQATAHEHGATEVGTPPAERNPQSETFARLIIGDFVRNHEDWVTGRPTPEHIQCIIDLLHTGKRLPQGARQTIWRMIMNTSFFITENGAIGLGSRDTEAGDEVWILYGSNVPFTVRKREGDDANEVDRDFVGRCYVQGIMFGEIFMDEERVLVERQVRLH
jgi:hypothetical protein